MAGCCSCLVVSLVRLGFIDWLLFVFGCVFWCGCVFLFGCSCVLGCLCGWSCFHVLFGVVFVCLGLFSCFLLVVWFLWFGCPGLVVILVWLSSVLGCASCLVVLVFGCSLVFVCVIVWLVCSVWLVSLWLFPCV